MPGDGAKPAMNPPASRIPLRTALQLCLLAGRGALAWHLCLVLLQGLIPLLGLYAMQWLVDAVAMSLRSGAAAGAPDDAAYAALWRATAWAAGIAVLGNVVRGLAAVTAESHARELGDRCAQRLQEHTARLDLEQFDRPAFHDLLHKAGAEAGQRPVRLVQDLAGFGTALVSLVAMSLVLALVQPWLPVLVAVAAAPIAVMRARHARLRFAWQERNVREQRANGLPRRGPDGPRDRQGPARAAAGPAVCQPPRQPAAGPAHDVARTGRSPRARGSLGAHAGEPRDVWCLSLPR